jgi:hypothetical protein
MVKIAGLPTALFVVLIGIFAFAAYAFSSYAPSNTATAIPTSAVSAVPTSTVTTAPVVPVTAAHSSNFNAIWYDYAGDTCYSAGRFWIFFYDGKQVGFVSSSDGQIWSTERPLGSAGNGTWAFYCSDNAFYYAISRDQFGPSVYYRHGNLTSAGTIQWAAPERMFNATGTLIRGISTIVDKNGSWWTTFSDLLGSNNTLTNRYTLGVEVWKCSAPSSCGWSRTGIWNTTDPTHGAYPQILSTGSGTIAVVWTVPNAGGNLSVRFYDGNAWSRTAELAGPFRMASSTCVSLASSIGCAASNDTAIVYATATLSNGSAKWSGFEELTGCSTSLAVQFTSPHYRNCFASASSDGVSRVAVTYIMSNSTVGSLESVDGGFHWVESTPFTTSETGSPIRISSPFSIGGYIQAAWVSGDAPPYSIRFISVPLAKVINNTVQSSQT